MRKILALLVFVAASAFAEASFQQVENMIEHQQYQSAEMALEGIISAHPNSAKAFYAMSQAQAGLGNLEKAQFALNKARALDPDLKFASASNIESLQQAITPQVKKIEVVEESHFARNVMLFIFALAMAFVIYYFFIRKPNEADDEYRAKHVPPKPMPPTPGSFTSNNAPSGSTNQGTSTPHTYNSSSTPSSGGTTVVNNYGSNNDGFVTGMLVGEMMNSGHHDTVVVQQPVYVQPPVYAAPAPAPTPTRDTSWDNDSSSSSSSSRSSSWDSDDSSSKSSSWSSSSSSDSSWSSSSSSSSDSSWDSGSSSSSDSSSDW